MSWVPIVYAAGVILGVVLTDAPPVARVILSLLWPLGIVAFLATMTLLLAVAVVTVPALALLTAVGTAAAWWVLR